MNDLKNILNGALAHKVTEEQISDLLDIVAKNWKSPRTLAIDPGPVDPMN